MYTLFHGILIYVFIKLDVTGGIDKAKEMVAENIDNSEKAKENSEANLQTIKDKVANLADEIDEIILKSEENAKLVGDQIINDANKSAENIKTNALKLIENKSGIIKNDILKRASLASVEVAKQHIIRELNNNFDLHNRLIDESIEAIQE